MCVFLVSTYSWGRGHPEEYTDAMHLGEERFDSIDSDKKPRAGQILWIRGLTRLQTQVSLSYPSHSNEVWFCTFNVINI